MTDTPANVTPKKKTSPTVERQTPDVSFGRGLRIIDSMTIGNGSAIDANRRTHGIKENGWQIKADRARLALNEGFDAIALHNPGGTLEGEEMLASQFVDADKAGLGWLTGGFVEAWLPITERAEVIAYVGSITLDAKIHQTYLNSQKDFLAYLAKCYDLPLAAHMSIAFDSHQKIDRNHWAVAAARTVEMWAKQRNTKAKMYFEPGPHVGDETWFGQGKHVWIANHNSAIINDEHQAWQMPLPIGTETICQLAMSPADICREEELNAPESFKDQWAMCEWSNYGTWITRWVKFQFDRGRSVAINRNDCVAHGLTARMIRESLT